MNLMEVIYISKISLIALDLGGTLLNDDNTISQENINTLAQVQNKGILLALATAREYSSTRYISHLINCDFGVFSNGSHLMDIKNLKSLKSSLITTKAVLEIYQYCQHHHLYIHLNQEFCEVSNQMDYFNLKHHILNQKYPPNLQSSCYLIKNLEDYIKHNIITKIVIASDNNLDEVLSDLKPIFQKYDLYLTEYNQNLYESILKKTINYIEIGATTASKASGLNHLANILNIPIEEILIFGDGDNDLEMFSSFPNTVCMQNGSNKARKLARYITTKDNNHSGVAEGINFFLKGGFK